MSELKTAFYTNPYLKIVYFLNKELSVNKKYFKEEQEFHLSGIITT